MLMEDIKLVEKPDILERQTSSETSLDCDRSEEKWSPRHELFLNNIKKECIERSKLHDEKSKYNLMCYRGLSIPMMILPIISAGVSEYLNEDLKYISTGLMVCSSAIGVVNTIYNFGKSSQQHNEYSGRYSDFSRDIDYTLCRRKRNRNACDVTVQKFVTIFKGLNTSAPTL